MTIDNIKDSNVEPCTSCNGINYGIQLSQDGSLVPYCLTCDGHVRYTYIPS